MPIPNAVAFSSSSELLETALLDVSPDGGEMSMMGLATVDKVCIFSFELERI